MGREYVPVERTADSAFGKEGIRERHPAFGMVGIYRTNGQRHLFGSPLEKHQNYVTIRVHRAERLRSGVGYDHYFARKQVIEVALSEAQFAQLITSWNSGDGVPCTLDWIAGEGMLPDWPDEDHTSDTERCREEFKDRIADVRKKMVSSINLMEGLLEKKGALTKAEKDQIRFGMTAVQRLLDDTGPFMAEQFVEATEGTVQKAKAEIDAFATRVVQQTGLDALRELRVAGLPSSATRALPEGPDAAERAAVEREGCSECGEFPCKELACPHIPGAGGVEFEPEEDE